MAIVAGFDVHRAQITFDALDCETGEVTRGRIAADGDAVRRWVERLEGREVHVAVEACTGWLFVCEALEAGGAVAHLAEPVETSALRGKKRRAKTDREDARWLRELLAEGRLPEAWIPPAHVREWRTRSRLRKTLIDILHTGALDSPRGAITARVGIQQQRHHHRRLISRAAVAVCSIVAIER